MTCFTNEAVTMRKVKGIFQLKYDRKTEKLQESAELVYFHEFLFNWGGEGGGVNLMHPKINSKVS